MLTQPLVLIQPSAPSVIEGEAEGGVKPLCNETFCPSEGEILHFVQDDIDCIQGRDDRFAVTSIFCLLDSDF